MLAIDEIAFPDDLLDNPNLKMSTSLLITNILINIAIYFFFIFKTESILKILKIDQNLGETRIGILDFNLQKYAQITLAIVAIFLFVLAIPDLILSIVQNFRIKDEYNNISNFNLVENSIICLFALALMLFNDKISKFLAK